MQILLCKVSMHVEDSFEIFKSEKAGNNLNKLCTDWNVNINMEMMIVVHMTSQYMGAHGHHQVPA